MTLFRSLPMITPLKYWYRQRKSPTGQRCEQRLQPLGRPLGGVGRALARAPRFLELACERANALLERLIGALELSRKLIERAEGSFELPAFDFVTRQSFGHGVTSRNGRASSMPGRGAEGIRGLQR